MAGFGEMVKSLVVRFTSENYEVVKEEINSIPDKKEVKVTFDMSPLGLAIKDLGAKIEQALGGGGGKDGFLSKLLFRGFGGINLPGPLGSLPSFFTSIPGLLALAAAAATALNAITMLVSGFAAATVGVGAFAALAMPTFKAVTGALTAIATDTAAYDAATTKTAKSDALKKIKADWAALDPAQKTAVKSIQAFQSTFDNMAQKFEPAVMPIFNDLLKIANNLLAPLQTFANAAAPALAGLFGNLAKFTGSTGFKDWVGQFSKISGPAITAIGHGIGDVASNFGKLLTIFSAKDDVTAINAFFRIISGAITGLGAVIKWLKGDFDELTQKWIPNLIHAWGNVSHAIDNVHHAFDNIGNFITKVFDAVMHAVGNFNHAIDNMRHFVATAAVDTWHAIDSAFHRIYQILVVDVANWIGKAVAWFKGLPGRIVGALGNVGSLLFHAGEAIIQGLINGIKAMASPLIGVLNWITGLVGIHKGPIEKDRLLLYPHGVAIMQGLMAGMGSQVPAMNRQLDGITRGIGGPHGVGVRTGGGYGNVNITVNGFVGSELQLALQIQRSLLALKRNRFGVQGNTSAGLGLA